MKQFRNMVYPYVAWIAVMIVAPMLMIVLYAFTTAGNDVTTIRFTLDNFARFFSDQVFLDVLWRSLFIAVITTIICVLVGYPIAYAIAQRSEKSNMFWVLVITMPHLDQYDGAHLRLGGYPPGRRPHQQPAGAVRHRAVQDDVHHLRCGAGYGLQLYPVHDPADPHLPHQDGQELSGGCSRSGRQQGAELPAGHPPR